MRSAAPLERALGEAPYPHMLGIVRRIRAALFLERGDASRARRALGESLELLRGSGRVTDLIGALDLASEVWPERRLRDEAGELRAAFGFSADEA